MNTIPAEGTAVLTAHEIAKATQYLIATRDSLFGAVASLDETQWHFKPASDQWSIAENLEHVLLIEYAVHGIVGRMPEAPAASPDRATAEIEEIILRQIPSRASKIQAPERIQPTHRWTPLEMQEMFMQARTRTIHLLTEAPALRGHVFPHPILGDWDGYQWILATGAHTARHTAQINEVKASLRA